MSQKTPIKTASKDILARAMAMEDIRVEHKADAPSAYFDVKNRVLGLPVWKDMDNSVYDMLVGHEVSHALHTPADGWESFVDKNGTRQMFLNVVEDARIERLIKDKFPGLKRDFANAYTKLHGQDLFELAERDINLDMPLIDRLNLHFKIGLFGLETIPFTADEQQYVTRMAETKTFEDVVALASDLYDLYKSEQEQEQPEEGEQGEQGTGGFGEGESGDSTESSDSDSDDDGETGQGTSAGDDESDDESGESESGDTGAESGEDSGESMEDDTDDGESAESNDTKGDAGEGGDDSSDLSYDSYENEPGAPGSTQRSFEQGVSDMRDSNARNREYLNLVDPVLDNIVADWKTIEAEWDGYHAKMGDKRQDYKVESLMEFKKFMNSSKGTVMSMVQAFQMKQAADASKRTDIAKTGVLDTVGMMKYRWSEDIFVKNEVHADGKNHGMVMYVDWSGSMTGILQDTVEQLLVLTEFCRKAGIPFDVYAFSSNEFLANPENHSYHSGEYQKMMEDNRDRKFWTGQECEKDENGWDSPNGNLRPHSFSLLHFLSSDMNARQMKTALSNLWLCTAAASHYGNYGCPHNLRLGCTPLNEAIVCAATQIPEFQRRHGVQIVNCVILSDGEGHGTGLNTYGGVGVLRDTKTGKTYECGRGRTAETDCFLDMLRDRTGANLVGIRLHDAKNITNLRFSHGWEQNEKGFEVACGEYKKMNFTEIPESAYDGYFLIKGNTELQTDTLDGIGDDASYTRLKNAFIKGGNNKKASRVIANRIVDIIAA